MVRHDLSCYRCLAVFMDQLVDPERLPSCRRCHCPTIEIIYLPRHSSDAACHPSETCTVYYSQSENKIQYPGRNDQPIPDRLKRRGYEKVEMRSIHDIERFEKQHHVVNERVWYDKGSGRSYEDHNR